MANAIGFGELFNKEDFNSGLEGLKSKIAEITQAIEDTGKAADALNKALGGELKEKIVALSSSNKDLDNELKKVRGDFDALKKSVVEINTTLKKYKDANDKLKEKTKELKDKLKQQKEEQAALNKVNKQATINYGQLAQSVIGVASGAALLYKGISMLKEQITLAVKSTIDFEQAMKEVQAISRASSDQLAALTANANKLGSSTEKTAVEVAGLQKELAKLGFTTVEIIASSQAVVDLSTATGESLAGSATVAAATLRAFGLEATEMTRVVDVMAGSFVRSGLDLEKFRESMKLVAPIARATGVDLEITTAALSKLADAGLSGSLAGTALRNLLSNMADPTSKLATRLGFTVQTSEDLVKAFKKLRAEGVGLAEAVQLVDVRARPAFFTLLNQIDSVENLSKEYRSLTGEGARLADMMRDTLANDIKIAESAFDALRRNLVEGFTPAMRQSTQALTDMIEWMRLFHQGAIMQDGVISDLIKGYIDWLIAVNPLVLSYKALTFAVSEFKDIVRALGGEWKTLEEAQRDQKFLEFTKQATSAIEVFNKSVQEVNMSPLVDEFKKLSEVNKKTEEQTKRLEEVERELVKHYGVTALAVDKVTGKKFINIEAIERTIRATVQEAKTTREMLELRVKEIDSEILLNKTTTEAFITQGKFYEATVQGNKASAKAIDLLREKDIILRALNTTMGATFDTSQKGWSVYTDAVGEAKKATEKFLEKEKERLKLKEEQDKRDAERAKQEAIRKKQEAEALKAFNLRVDLLIKEKETTITALENAAKLADAEGDKARALALGNKVYEERVRLLLTLREKELENIARSEDSVENKLNKEKIAYEDHHQKLMDLSTNWLLFQMKEHEASLKSTEATNKARFDLSMEDARLRNKAYKEFLESQKKEDKDFWENWERAADIALRGTAQSVNLLYDNMAIRRDNELRGIDKWEQERIRLAGDNAEAIAAIEAEAEQKRKQIKIRQAKADKTEALFQIAIQTAVNVIRAWKLGPLAVIAAGALGAIQAGIVAARPLPEFYKGTENSPEGHAWVGERGRELVKDGKTGKVSVTPDKPTIAYLTKGSVVVPHEKTERILASHNPDYNGIVLNKSVEKVQSNQPSIDYDKLIGGFKTAVKDIPLTTTNFDENGVRQFVRKGNARIERLNARYKY
jgi:TP901 family phage tail tape measure protein